MVETVFRRYDEAVLLREEVQPEFESAVANYIPRRSESRTKLQNALDALMRNKKAPMQVRFFILLFNLLCVICITWIVNNVCS